MKKCGKCNIEKELREFNKNKARKDGLQSYCRPCDRERALRYFNENHSKVVPKILEARKERVKRNRLFVNKYCNITDIRVFEFDHVKGTKLENISQLIAHGASIKRLTDEIEKCVVRCGNCHKIKTALQFNYYGYLAEVD